MSETTCVPRAPSSVRSLWIFGGRLDLLLIVATPVLIGPLVWAASQRWTVEGISLFVLAFGALGHHLPGMIRAYGDRELFRQYRVRFIVAPLLLVAICVWSVLQGLHGLILVTVVWGVWHALMQTHGFVRIYDAKVGSTDRLTAWLDFGMCFVWFGAAVILSPARFAMLLDLFYQSGAPLLPGEVFTFLRMAWLAGTLLVTLAFAANLLLCWRKGVSPSPVKLLLMAVSFAFYWYTNVLTGSLLLGLAMFEIFHDVQYFAIGWVFNRNRVEKGASVTPFVRFLFRRSGTLVGLYVGLILAYGSLRYVEQGLLAPGTVRDVLTGILVASGLLHFYFDGFIWKMRQPSTRQGLEIEGGDARLTSPRLPRLRRTGAGWLTHGLKWSAFVVPIVWLALTESRGPADEIDRLRAITRAVPHHTETYNQLGFALQAEGRLDEAERTYRTALLLGPDDAAPLRNLGTLYTQQGRTNNAVNVLRKSVKLTPNDTRTHVSLGNALRQLGLLEEAAASFRTALELAPDSLEAHNNLAITLARQGRFDEAEKHVRRALTIEPAHQTAAFNLGLILSDTNRVPEAMGLFERILSADPSYSPARHHLATLLEKSGRREEALAQYRHTLEVDPRYEPARRDMVRLLQAGS